MFKKNFIFIFLMVVVVLILVVLQPPIVAVALIGLVLGILWLPGMRNILLKDGPRKVKAALYTSLSFTVGLFIFYLFVSLFKGDGYGMDFLSVVMILIFSLLGNFLYGLPASIVAEMISMRFMANRVWVSGLIHVGLGAVTYFYNPGFSLAAVCCSVLFFIIDERIRKDH